VGISSSLGSSALLPAGLGFRNTLANGGFSVDQRNSGAAQTITAAAALAYTTDRWYAYCTGANVTSQRIAGPAPFQYNHQFTGATSNTLIGFGQRIEAANSFNYAGNTATLSAYIKSSSLTSVTWTLYYATSTDSFGTVASPTRTQIATGTFTISSTLTRYSAQFVVPAAATTGLELVFTTGALVASQTLVFAGVQLEQNYQPTPFEQRPIGVELALCQRYYQRRTGSGTSTYTSLGGFGAFGSSTAADFDFVLPVVMRVVPHTIDYHSASGFVGSTSNVSYTSTSLGIQTVTATAQVFAITLSGMSGTAGLAVRLLVNNSTSGYLGWSAEL